MLEGTHVDIPDRRVGHGHGQRKVAGRPVDVAGGAENRPVGGVHQDGEADKVGIEGVDRTERTEPGGRSVVKLPGPLVGQ